MQIISGIRIQGFRSIVDEKLSDLGNHTIIVGKNSSGKSNALRALSLFFNEQPNPGVPIDFNRDVYFRPLRKQKKEIRVEVEFTLPDRIKFRTGLERIKQLGSKFSIRKTWSLDRLGNVLVGIIVSKDGSDLGGESQTARDFLSLIRFRYIPNRTVPAELLRDESQVIGSAIFKKLKEASKAADVLKGLSESAERLLAKTATALHESGAPISQPNIATAESLGDMLSMSGFLAAGLNGVRVRDEDWGSGHQAFFLLRKV